MLKKYSQLFLSALIISDSLVILSSWIRHWSLFFDLKILIKTLWNGLINRHAY